MICRDVGIPYTKILLGIDIEKMTVSSNFGKMFSMLGASAFLPFLPMLPVQILIQNLFYNISQTSIPWNRMDADFLEQPKKWEASDITRVILFIGPISFIFDYATFALMFFFQGMGNSDINHSCFINIVRMVCK